VLEIQFQHIKGTDLGQFKDLSTQVVILQAQYESGNLIHPYDKAKYALKSRSWADRYGGACKIGRSRLPGATRPRRRITLVSVS
jgi:hypothetical protein